ncbi:MAG: nitrilase [Solirubrobacteraceae bacterium]
MLWERMWAESVDVGGPLVAQLVEACREHDIHCVIGVNEHFPIALPEGKEVFGEGGAAIVEPTWGGVLAGPLRGEEGMVVADCDLRAGLHAKRWFDAVGHYSRADVLEAPEDETAPA